MISPIKRKTLPEIAKVTGLDQEQSLHHFLTKSPWSASELKKQRLSLILQELKGRRIFLIIDETGDNEVAEKEPLYVNRQYLGKLGKIDNGMSQ
jgi:SRSO17 transposase